MGRPLANRQARAAAMGQTLRASRVLGVWRAVPECVAAERLWTTESSDEFSGNNWLIGSFGFDSNTNQNAFLTTDCVHASECGGEGALADAQVCAELRNLLPQIITALRSRATFEKVTA